MDIGWMAYGFEGVVKLLDRVAGILVDVENRGQRYWAVDHLELVGQVEFDRLEVLIQDLPGV